MNTYDVWQKPTQYCKVIILQLKISNFFKKKKKKRLIETLRIQLRLSKSVQIRFYPIVLDYSGRNKNKHTM